jgi:hypothetical protein
MEQIDYIRLISKLSNCYGDKLIELMDFAHTSCLKDVSKEEAKEFYEKRCTA